MGCSEEDRSSSSSIKREREREKEVSVEMDVIKDKTERQAPILQLRCPER